MTRNATTLEERQFFVIVIVLTAASSAYCVIPAKAIVKPGLSATAFGGYGLDNSLGRNGGSTIRC
jgi:hypothetical protein